MQKQYNRGQDGAGLGVVKFDMPAGDQFLLRIRSDKHNAIERIFDAITEDTERLSEPITSETEMDAKRSCRFLGEAYLGHLRYGTHSGNSLAMCHPFVRKSNVASRNIALAGNFNMTNSSELFDKLVASATFSMRNTNGLLKNTMILKGVHLLKQFQENLTLQNYSRRLRSTGMVDTYLHPL
jgi:amidophosphoribosyltransferase